MAIVGAFMVPHPPIILEEVGHRRERSVEQIQQALLQVAKKIKELRPETIVVISPHVVMYEDYFHISKGLKAEGDFTEFGAPEVKMQVSYDWEFVGTLEECLNERGFLGGTLGEKNKHLDHGTMVPLYFINQEYREYQLVRMGISGQSFSMHYTLGSYIKEISEQLDRRVVIVASGDLSHRLKEDGPYGFHEKGPVYDEYIMRVMESGDFGELFHFSEDLCQSAGECGHRSFLIMAGALDKTDVIATRLAYEGPFGVGYGVCEYEATGRNDKRNFLEQFTEQHLKERQNKRVEEDDFVRLARHSLETFVMSGRIMNVPSELNDELTGQMAGTFVSIKKDGKLRGCIGTLEPTKDSIAEEIIHNAISAGRHDPRFAPVVEEELDDLEYSVDVLGEMEEIDSEDELDIVKYGVVVSSGRKRGLLLPNLEGIHSVEEQIQIAKQKAGIVEDEKVTLERFQVIRHK